MVLVGVLEMMRALILSCLLTAVGAHAEPVSVQVFARDRLLNSVVSIQAGETETLTSGFGLIIGRRDDTVWVATAAHLLFPEGRRDSRGLPLASSRIIVTFRNGDHFDHAAGKPEIDGTDIALLPLHLPLREIGFDRWTETVIDDQVKAGDPIFIAGHELAIDWFDSEQVVKSVGADGTVRIESFSAGAGQSGAPVASTFGFFGIYAQADGKRIIPMAEIHAAAVQADRPWQIIAASGRVETARLCLNVTGADLAQLRVRGPQRLGSLDANACFESVSGTHGVFIFKTGWVCSPEEVSLPAHASERIDVSCHETPEGSWGGKDGVVTITRGGKDNWLIREGLQQSPYGSISGSLEGTPPILMLHAATSTGASIQGQATVSNGHLTAHAFVDGVPWNLELTR